MSRSSHPRRPWRRSGRPGSGDVVAQARLLLADGHAAQALPLLRRVLPSQVPVAAVRPDRDLVDAAVLFVHATCDDPAQHLDRLAWGGYARDASRALPGEPDLRLILAGADAFAHACNALRLEQETFDACREAIRVAEQIGDVDDVWYRRVSLGVGFIDRHCAEVADDAVAAFIALGEKYPDTTIDATLLVPLIAALDGCHRHEQAEALAPLIWLTDMGDEAGLGLVLRALTDHGDELVEGLTDHADREHPGFLCPRTDCAVSIRGDHVTLADRTRAMTARIVLLLLAQVLAAETAPGT